VRVVSKITERSPEEICLKAGIPLLLAPSIKAGLDIDWSDAKQKAMAIEVVERQVSSLQQWVDRHLDDVIEKPLLPYLNAITQIRDQDLETWSARADKPMITLNCAALPETLVESELFGYERGAFSDARAPKLGLLEREHGGTVFLDEVGELPLGAQAKLLRALEAKRITRLGDVREREVDFRIVAATNRDLEAESRAGRFREDLLFRLSTAVVALPPLRHRPREVPLLSRLFLAAARARAGKTPLELSEAVLARLATYPFPGNVRELKNAMEYAAAIAEGDVVELWSLPDRIAGPGASATPAAGEHASQPPPRFRPVVEELKELERTRMREALAVTGGVQTRAAELIGMPTRTFVFKLKQYGIEAKRRP
jgi:two-component system, NtrC family, response regulator AtoC